MISRSASPSGAQKRTKFYLTVATVAFALSIGTPAYAGNGNGKSQGFDKSGEHHANPRSETAGSSSSTPSDDTSSASSTSSSPTNGSSSGSSKSGPPAGGSSSGGASTDAPSSEPTSVGSSKGGSSSDSSSDELKRPPSSGGSSTGSSSSNDSGDDGNTSFFSPTTRTDKYETKFRRAQKELARLFVLSERQIQTEFPGGGFDEALLRAADRARRAERAYQRNSS